MSSIRALVSKFKNSTPSNRISHCNRLSKALLVKIDAITDNWPMTDLSPLYNFSMSIKNNQEYLTQMLESPELFLLTRSRLQIALDCSNGSADMNLKDNNSGLCRGMKGENKLLIENPYANSRKYQVWAHWTENTHYIRKHMGNPTKNASVWSKEIDRQKIQKLAILNGKGKFKHSKRIDFVFKHDTNIGSLKVTHKASQYVYVELVREELKNKQHKSSFHGFPISQSEYEIFSN